MTKKYKYTSEWNDNNNLKFQDLKAEFNMEIEKLKRTQDELKMELKTSIAQSESSGKPLQVQWIKQKVEYQTQR